MISKTTFIRIMDKLMAFNDRLDKLTEVLREFSPYADLFWVYEPFSIVDDILDDIFDDGENGWLAYFIYERDFLRDYRFGDVLDAGVPVDLSDWSKVYDFLIENMRHRDGAKDKE